MSTEPPRRTNHSARLEHQREWWAQEQQKTVETAIVDGTTPLTENQAKTLDQRIRLMVGSISDQLDKLAGLIAEAKAGQIHIALGYASWTAYVKDAIQVAPKDKAERKALVTLMSGQGMSQRAIGAALDVSKKTVTADLREVSQTGTPDTGSDAEPSNVIGLDGKSYQRKPTPTEVADAVKDDPAAALAAREAIKQRDARRKPKPEPEPEDPLNNILGLVQKLRAVKRKLLDSLEHASNIRGFRESDQRDVVRGYASAITA